MSLNNEQKMKLNKIKKGILIVCSIIAVVILLSILQYAIYYYSNPIKEEVSFSATGCLIYNTEERFHELVPVEMNGENLHYFFRNREDCVQGDIFVNGYSIFGEERNGDTIYPGFYTEFYKGSNYTCTSVGGDYKPLCEIIAISRDWNVIVCGITVDAAISDKAGSQAGTQALLVIPAGDIDTAIERVREVALNSEQMNEWLTKNGWIPF